MLNLRFQGNGRKLWQFAAAFSLLLFVSVITAHAQLLFADFNQQDGTQQNFIFTNNTTNGTFSTVPGGNPISFRYQGVSGLPAGSYPVGLVGFQDAHLSITNATTTATGTNISSNTTQPINGLITILITRDTPFNGGTVLLRVEIASTSAGLPASGVYPAQPASASTTDLSGTTGGDSFTFSGSTSLSGQSIRFTSDFLDFTQTTSRAFAINFSGLSTPFALNANGFLNSLLTPGGGSFSSNPRPFYNPPTAASVNIGGRILTADGRGVSRARVSLTDASGVTRTITSNSFGYYRFEGVEAGQTVIVSVTSKRYTFTSQVVSVANDLTGLNFTSLE